VQIQNKATVYVCRNYACDAPVNTVEQFRTLLENSTATGNSQAD